MKSIARCRGVKSPNTGWQWESISPGTTVLPRASITVSASPSSPRPTAVMRPSSMAMVSPSRSGRAMSPETICPMLRMSVFIDVPPSASFEDRILTPGPGPVKATSRVSPYTVR